jgi:hypothetical protein
MYHLFNAKKHYIIQVQSVYWFCVTFRINSDSLFNEPNRFVHAMGTVFTLMYVMSCNILFTLIWGPLKNLSWSCSWVGPK